MAKKVTPTMVDDTLVSLRDYFESRLDANQLAVQTARELMEARMTAAERELERRLEGLNHLRNTVLTRGEFEMAHSALAAELKAEAGWLRQSVAEMREWRALQDGKASMASVYVSYLIGFGGLITGLVAMIHELMT